MEIRAQVFIDGTFTSVESLQRATVRMDCLHNVFSEQTLREFRWWARPSISVLE